MKKIKFDVVNSKIQDLIQLIKETGESRYISRIDKNTKELQNYVFEFNPREVFLDALSPSQKELLKKEENIVNPIIQNKFYDIMNLLLNDVNTRQAIAINMPDRLINANEFPCLSMFHIMTRGNELDMKVFVRSSNVEKHLFVDCWFLSELLKKVSKNVGKKMGRITLFISNAHVYE
jgi:thymidylate synthase